MAEQTTFQEKKNKLLIKIDNGRWIIDCHRRNGNKKLAEHFSDLVRICEKELEELEALEMNYSNNSKK